jgi:hypothetical protein
VLQGPNDRGSDVRRLVVTENITLDGVIDAAEGWFLPSGDPGADESDQLAVVQEQAAASDAFLTGRVTFEAMRVSGHSRSTTRQASPSTSTGSPSTSSPRR